MGHWPVQNALKPVREVLGSTPGRVRVVELDAESPEGEKRLKAVGLKGHIPIAAAHRRQQVVQAASGKSVEFVDFPGGRRQSNGA